MLIEAHKKNWTKQYSELLYWTSNEQFKSKKDLPFEKVSKITSACLTIYFKVIIRQNETQCFTYSIYTEQDSKNTASPEARDYLKLLSYIYMMELLFIYTTRRLHRRSLRLPTRRKWAQSGYLCTTRSTAQAGADAGISWS